MTSIIFEAIGLPSPQGSKSAFVRGNRAVIVDGTSKAGRQKHVNWRDTVTSAAMQAKVEGLLQEGPVSVEMEFFLPLPASDPHRTLHSTKPDVDKLIRSVFDSLTNSGLIKDDAQIGCTSATKVYARDGHYTGVRVTVTDWSDTEAVNRDNSKTKARESKKAQLGKTSPHKPPKGEK